MEGIVKVVTNSAQCNEAQLVSKEDGSIIVPSYDWTGFLAPHMKKIVDIENFLHFRMSSSSPGDVFLRESSEVKITIVKQPWTPETDKLPPVLSPQGLVNGNGICMSRYSEYSLIRPRLIRQTVLSAI